MKRKQAISRYPQTAKRRRATSSTPVPKLNVARPRAFEKQYDPTDYKIIDTVGNGLAITAAGQIFDLFTGITPGVSPVAQFVGQKITPVGLQWKWNWAVGDNTNIMRIIIFQWMDANVPTTAGILQTVNALSAISLTNRENINSLIDETDSLAILSPGGSNCSPGKRYVKGKKMAPMQWNIAAGRPQKGGIYALIISDSTVLPNPTMTFYSRITYLDN